jgi:putative ABC transport system substrate-binding protein
MAARDGAQRRIPRVGWLVPGSQATQQNLAQYRRGMSELGYVEGRNVETEYLYADGQSDRLAKLAAALVTEKVDVIVTAGTPGCLAAKQATTAIPIVFAVSSDPLSTGVVTSLGHPEGNITGLSLMATDLSASGWSCCKFCYPASVGWRYCGILPTPGWRFAYAKPSLQPSS